MSLHKSGDPKNCNNYRGIAISSCLGEIFTSILQMRLLNFIEDTNHISDNQAVFWKTTDLLSKVL